MHFAHPDLWITVVFPFFEDALRMTGWEQAKHLLCVTCHVAHALTCRQVLLPPPTTTTTKKTTTGGGGGRRV